MIELSLILIRMLIDINSGPANAIGATFLAPAKNSTGIPVAAHIFHRFEVVCKSLVCNLKQESYVELTEPSKY